MLDVLGPAWVVPLVAAPFIGSFLGVVVTRLPAGASVVSGRSVCPGCERVLAPRDLVPVLAWLWSRGRCRFCDAEIGRMYPAIELAAAGVVLWAAVATSGWILWAGCVLGWTLLALAFVDQREGILCDELTLPLIPAGLAMAYAIDPAILADHLLGAGAGFLAFVILGRVYRRLRGREGLGPGDAKLLAAIGAWVSWAGLASVVLLAAVMALGFVAWRSARSSGGPAMTPSTALPFGPYLCLAGWIVWLHGPIVPAW
jgi:leader peptidase (prepilin peptidase)/N-methyltransferase